MRSNRLGFTLLAVYMVFIGGGAYYNLIFPVRILHHVVVTSLLAWWLSKRIRRGEGLPDTKLKAPIFALVLVWFISGLFAIDRRVALENLWFPLTHVLMFFVLLDLFQRRRQRLIMDTQFMLGALVVLVSGLQLGSWYFGWGVTPGTAIGWVEVIGPGAWIPLESERLWLALGVSTWVSAYSAPLVIVAAVWGWTVQRRDYRIILWLLAAGQFVVLILSASRGGILSLAAALGLLIFLRLLQVERFHGRMGARVVAFGGIAAAGLAIALLLVFSISQQRAQTDGDKRRLDMWASAAEMTRDRPLFGLGPGSFGRAFRDYRDPTIVDDRMATAHNIYLNTAAETGLAGFIVAGWLALSFAYLWQQKWRATTGAGARLRLEATFAALVGVAVQSLFDTFTITPLILLMLVLVVYSIARPRALLDARTHTGGRWQSVAALGIVLIYGGGLLYADRAHFFYQRSLDGGEDALEQAQRAARSDPDLGLYELQVLYLTGERAAQEDLDVAVEAYESALELEPTWDTGWINLASLVARQGNVATALGYLQRAHAINNSNGALFHWARLAEEADAATPEAIVAAYMLAFEEGLGLPLSDFWGATALRREVVEQYMAGRPLDEQYRVWTVHDPQRLEALVPESPTAAAQWWVVGQHALTVQRDEEKALAAFSAAIERDPGRGDFYASRARAELEINPDEARRDLNIAQLLGTRLEYPNAVRLHFAETADEIEALRIDALPPRVTNQNFAGVLYAGRSANFDLFPDMRRPGPGRAALQPWYDLAAQRLADGRVEDALIVYEAIVDYAPYETEAVEQLERLRSDTA